VQAVNKYQSGAGGPLLGGDPGKRLIEPSQAAKGDYFTEIPPAFERRDGELLVVSVHHIFGSEELSALSPGVAELSPKPCVVVGPAAASRLKLNSGDEVELALNGKLLKLALKVRPAMPEGIAALSAGLPGQSYAELPAWGRVSGKAGNAK
jgi:NADH-quinone oxidoreductase subunit G